MIKRNHSQTFTKPLPNLYQTFTAFRFLTLPVEIRLGASLTDEPLNSSSSFKIALSLPEATAFHEPG